MKNQNVYCARCGDTVKERTELVTVWKFISLVSYHRECYATEVKSSTGAFLGTPINSVTTTVTSVMLLIFCVYLFVRTHSWFFLLLAVVGLLIRGVSWFWVERKLK